MIRFSLYIWIVSVFSFIKCFGGVGWKMEPVIKLVLL